MCVHIHISEPTPESTNITKIITIFHMSLVQTAQYVNIEIKYCTKYPDLFNVYVLWPYSYAHPYKHNSSNVLQNLRTLNIRDFIWNISKYSLLEYFIMVLYNLSQYSYQLFILRNKLQWMGYFLYHFSDSIF